MEYEGLVTKSHVHAELGQIIAGQKSGRENDDEVIVFDSTGTALQDVAAASIVSKLSVSAPRTISAICRTAGSIILCFLTM